MKITLLPKPIGGTVHAISSKSHAHRLLISAALCDRETRIFCPDTSDDINATARCLDALCARVRHVGQTGFLVDPSRLPKSSAVHELDCGESGSTYRFLLPVACALGEPSLFRLHGRLPSRPMDPLWDVLEAHGIRAKGKGESSVYIEGQLSGGRYELPGNVSSQFISGLIFALPLLPRDSEIIITESIESINYIDITLNVVKQFGIRAQFLGNRIAIGGNQRYDSPKSATVEGDWSNAAFFLCAAAASGSPLTYTGLSLNSVQGDRAIVDVLRQAGAQVTAAGNTVTLAPQLLKPICLDAAQIPDMVPAVAVLCAAAQGESRIENAERLRFKESDRLDAVCNVLSALGGDVRVEGSGLTIQGRGRLSGGTVSSMGDHRIAMMAAVASVIAENPVTICGAAAVNKSYPGFFQDFQMLGGILQDEE